jgi:hypothetical protein
VIVFAGYILLLFLRSILLPSAIAAAAIGTLLILLRHFKTGRWSTSLVVKSTAFAGLLFAGWIGVKFYEWAALHQELASVLPGARCDAAALTVVSDESFDGSRTVRIGHSPDCIRSIANVLAGFQQTLPGFAQDGIVPTGDLYRVSFSVEPGGQSVLWHREGQ